MKRNVIEINPELCDGCEQCVDACAEGAIQMVDGKAVVVKDEFCDGLGACIGDCPTGALLVVEREAAAYDPAATEKHVRQLRGEAGVKRMQDHAEAHAHGHGHGPAAHAHGHSPGPAAHAHAHPAGGGGCPSAKMMTLQPGGKDEVAVATSGGAGLPPKIQPSDLAQWPVQLHLVPPSAPFFQDKELLVLATCGPVASADVHWRYLRGRSVVMACPKLDVTDPYVAKLAAIFAQNRIPKVVIVRLQVPCCGGLSQMVLDARTQSGRDDLVIEEAIMALDGAILRQEVIAGPSAAQQAADPQRKAHQPHNPAHAG